MSKMAKSWQETKTKMKTNKQKTAFQKAQALTVT